MKVYNSLSKETEEFVPLDPNHINMYVCGLTPYDSAHIGHARTYVSFDLIKRFLISRGFKVFHIQNITDVEDKIIKRCRETGADPKVLTEANHKEALELFAKLNILSADVYPKVTGHIPEILGMIGQLVKRGYAYETASGVYFNVAKFRTYGQLSGQNLDEIKAGSRFEVDETKKDAADFAVWKKTSGDLIEFDSPWGRGRPGWHIECSAMSDRYAKHTLDIHGGARDLIFPHHENEIAQSEAALGRKFCNYWLHTGFLTVGGEKMSKSLGNFITLAQALSKNTPNALRLFYLQAHYRSPLDYDEAALEAAEESVERIFNSVGLIREALQSAGSDSSSHANKPANARVDAHIKVRADAIFREKSNAFVEQFYAQLDDDFNTPEALAALFGLLRLSNSQVANPAGCDFQQLSTISKELEKILWILGFVEPVSGIAQKYDSIIAIILEVAGSGGGSDCVHPTKFPKEKPGTAEAALDLLISWREDARKRKDYKLSDLIRSRLAAIGIVIEDKDKSGSVRWKLAH